MLKRYDNSSTHTEQVATQQTHRGEWRRCLLHTRAPQKGFPTAGRRPKHICPYKGNAMPKL
eukprot:10648867-Lingulodinium_polyedra.AAC.1